MDCPNQNGRLDGVTSGIEEFLVCVQIERSPLAC